MQRIALALSLTLALTLGWAAAQQAPVPAKPAPASPLAWLSGHWTGEGFGGRIDEWWSPDVGGSMVCAFRLAVDGKPTMYELVTISGAEGERTMRLRHFHPDLLGWEDDTGPLVWPQNAVEEGRASFGPVVYELESPSRLRVQVEVGGEHPHVEEFVLRRQE